MGVLTYSYKGRIFADPSDPSRVYLAKGFHNSKDSGKTRENPPDLSIAADDILFFDFGPVFEEWEADVGRTYVLGGDSVKHQLQSDIFAAWHEGRAHFDMHPDITGAELYDFSVNLARQRGWEYGGPHCGHLIGNFPHERIQGEEIENYIHPDNHKRMRDTDRLGGVRHWIYEIHFVDRERKIGGFFEQLLTGPKDVH